MSGCGIAEAGCMRGWIGRGSMLRICAATVAWTAWLVSSGSAGAAEAGDVERGAYLFAVAGCGGCHTELKQKGLPLAGGPALKTPFGTFYGPNITPDPVHGIGGWSDADFVRALREGLSPDGSYLYPAFPYPAFTRMRDEDMLAIKAYIFAQPPVAQPSRPHEVSFPHSWRSLLGLWRSLTFCPGAFQPDAA